MSAYDYNTCVREDFLSAVRSDLVRTLLLHSGGNEREAMRVASEFLQTLQHRFGGERVYVPARYVDEAQIRADWRGDNHEALCVAHRISRPTLYRILARGGAASDASPATPPESSTP